MCVLIFSTTFVWNISHSKKNSASYYHKCTQVFMWSTRYSCQILTKLEFSRLVFEKYSNIKFHENLSSGSRVVPCGQTDGWMDGQTDMTKLVVAYRSFAKAPNKSDNSFSYWGENSWCGLKGYTTIYSANWVPTSLRNISIQHPNPPN
jgi:hypothetical protein